MKVACFGCGGELEAGERVGRRDTCPGCGRDLRCCRNCRFYAPSMSNHCREPQAERQADKERSNFCDFFEAGVAAVSGPVAEGGARSALESLFDRSKS
jgi:hypothetical protein